MKILKPVYYDIIKDHQQHPHFNENFTCRPVIAGSSRKFITRTKLFRFSRKKSPFNVHKNYYTPVKLHENQIPQFNYIRTARVNQTCRFFRTTMTGKMYLCTRPTWTSFTHHPEVLLKSIWQDFLCGNTAKNQRYKNQSTAHMRNYVMQLL